MTLPAYTGAQTIEVIPAVVPLGSTELHGWARAAGEFANSMHVDIADGIFVPNASWPFTGNGEFQQLGNESAAVLLEAHLMVAEPKEIGKTLIGAGFRRIIVHIEALSGEQAAAELLNTWRAGATGEVGFAILAHTPIEALDPFAHMADFIHVLTVSDAGASGHAIDPHALDRVAACHARYPKKLIAADGHIDVSNAASFVRAGAHRLIVGSAITKAPNPRTAWEAIKKAGEAACG